MFLRGGLVQLLSDLILAVGHRRASLLAAVAAGRRGPCDGALVRAQPAVLLRPVAEALRRDPRQIASLYALLSERVSAVRVVRSFAKEEAELAALDERIDTHRALSWQNTRAAAALGALATLISGLGTVFVISYGVVLVGRGTISVGALLAFYALVGQLYAPIVRLTQFQATALATQVSVERLYEIFDEPEPVSDREGARPIVHPQGALEFRDVQFAFGQAPVRWPTRCCAGVNLRIEPGMRVGILGPSGAGKTTLLALAPRLYDVPEGRGRARGHRLGRGLL